MRECGECRACCTLLPVEAISKPINVRCQYVCGDGCSIYKSRPTTCAEFECGYLQSDAPEKLRPDKCGVMFIKRADRIFSGLLIPGVPVTDDAKRQIDSFQAQGFSVVLTSLNEDTQLVRLAKGHNPKEIEREYKESLSGNL